jgi:hypothetical protein
MTPHIRRLLPTLTLACALTLLGPAAASAAEESALPKPNWGVNFWAHDFYTGDACFVNATRAFSYPAEWQKDPQSIPMTRQGVPLKPIKLRSLLGGYPDGIYKLRYEGKGEIRFYGGAAVVEGSLRKEGNFTFADVKVDRSREGLVEISFHDVNLLTPVQNVRLICPPYPVDTDKVCRDEFVRRLQPFSTLRFMDWNATNNSAASRWDDRRKPDYLVQTPGWRPRLPMGGMAYELMIAVCNESGRDMWMCVPHLADDHYVHRLAQLLRDKLDPQRKLYIELSNELWNFAQGPQLGRRMIGPDWSWQNQQGVSLYYGAVAPRLAEIGRIFKKEFGPQAADRLEIVLAGQSGNPWHCDQALQYFKDKDIRPKDVIDAIAIAPYFRPQGKFTDYDKMMQAMLETLESRIEPGIRKHRDLAAFNGLKLYAYEGGQHFWYNVVDAKANPEASKFIARAQNDPRMREAYIRYFKLWRRLNAGGLFMHYTFTSGSWGLLATLREPGSVKWDAVMSCLLPAGDADLDGNVTVEDLRILQPNLGKEGPFWWEQGDFNADGKVDKLDVDLLIPNLATPLTDQQKARLEALRKPSAEKKAP